MVVAENEDVAGIHLFHAHEPGRAVQNDFAFARTRPRNDELVRVLRRRYDRFLFGVVQIVHDPAVGGGAGSHVKDGFAAFEVFVDERFVGEGKVVGGKLPGEHHVFAAEIGILIHDVNLDVLFVVVSRERRVVFLGVPAGFLRREF